ncbi:hypothetical protein VKT23_017840 [Stygiomarasmius scandens]|uniref:CFEM domain-containing protein n=1 Tax=Marasmiellus scandens TaxID=2682957 RepID=A0ABR1IR15_9AGAR
MFNKLVGLVVLAAALSVHAQDTCGTSDCVTKCVGEALPKSSCSSKTDLKCACSDSSFAGAAAGCVNSNCPDQFGTALNLQQEICNNNDCLANCISQAASQSSCGASGDISCLCNDPTFGSAAAQCVTNQCPDKVQAALKLQSMMCPNMCGSSSAPAPPSTEAPPPPSTSEAPPPPSTSETPPPPSTSEAPPPPPTSEAPPVTSAPSGGSGGSGGYGYVPGSSYSRTSGFVTSTYTSQGTSGTLGASTGASGGTGGDASVGASNNAGSGCASSGAEGGVGGVLGTVKGVVGGAGGLVGHVAGGVGHGVLGGIL